MRYNVEEELQRLVLGLADQEAQADRVFQCDNDVMRQEDTPRVVKSLHPDEVVDILFPSLLCLSQQLAQEAGQGDLGYEFSLSAEPNPIFPLKFRRRAEPKLFCQVAPYLAHVVLTMPAELRHDVSRVFERAAATLDPAFALRARMPSPPQA
jgi:hypothetical protein